VKDKLGLACVKSPKLEGSGKMPDGSLIWLDVTEQRRSIKFHNKVTRFSFQAFLYPVSKNRWGELVGHLQHFPLFLDCLLESSP